MQIHHRHTGAVLADTGADLRGADLLNAILRGADLTGAALCDADLRRANLRDADLTGTDLRGADLTGADLTGANLRYAMGNMREVKSAQFDTYHLAWTAADLAIGCEQHTHQEWWELDDHTIARMDEGALVWWREWKPLLMSIIKSHPAI